MLKFFVLLCIFMGIHTGFSQSFGWASGECLIDYVEAEESIYGTLNTYHSKVIRKIGSVYQKGLIIPGQHPLKDPKDCYSQLSFACKTAASGYIKSLNPAQGFSVTLKNTKLSSFSCSDLGHDEEGSPVLIPFLSPKDSSFDDAFSTEGTRNTLQVPVSPIMRGTQNLGLLTKKHLPVKANSNSKWLHLLIKTLLSRPSTGAAALPVIIFDRNSVEFEISPLLPTHFPEGAWIENQDNFNNNQEQPYPFSAASDHAYVGADHNLNWIYQTQEQCFTGQARAYQGPQQDSSLYLFDIKSIPCA